MRRFNSALLLGMLLLILGSSIALDLVVDLRLPLLQSVAAMLLLLWGSQLVSSAWDYHERRVESVETYNVVFGKRVIDLTALKDPAEDVTVSVGALFGSATVKVDPAIAYDVQVDETFGTVRTPKRAHVNEDGAYSSPTTHRPRLHLHLSSTFGSCKLVEVAASA